MSMAAYIPNIHPWNQQIWQNLTNEPERANHALLFTGTQGLGKLNMALALAHFVLTETHSQSEALFNAGSHPDFHVLMPEEAVVELDQEVSVKPSGQPGQRAGKLPRGSIIESRLLAAFARRYLEPNNGKPKRTISIEQIRKLSAALTTFPHISSHRVIIIARAETMNRNAANALLKSLEEPPANTLFIVVSDSFSKLAKTIRSRCSLIHFRAPDLPAAQSWLESQGLMPDHEVAPHLAMAGNHPLLAYRLFQEGYVDALKSVFTDVNGLWNQRRNPVEVAQNWQQLGGLRSIEILQKLTTDLLRSSLADAPPTVYFPVQQSWVKSVSSKLAREKLLGLIDELNYAKRMLTTTVDELLVLETVSNKIRQLPAH